jgi:bifunctional non-homologous end joining protein LigD
MVVEASEVERRAAELGGEASPASGRRIAPMLCAQDDTRETILSRAGWVYELKLDGVRIIADKDGDRVSLAYRKARDATATYPEIAEALRLVGERRLVLDGEIVAFDEGGKPNFQRLARRIHLSSDRDVYLARRAVPVSYVVFDVLAVGAYDVCKLPLTSRRELLDLALAGLDAGPVRTHPQLDDGKALFALCREHGLEGVVAKRAESTYRAGERSADWVKVKCERDDELVVIGWTKGEGRRQRLGALDLGAYADGELVVRGRVGSGLDEATIDALLARMAPLAVDGPVAQGKYERKAGRTHVRPEIVVSVRYLGWSDEGMLRFPVFRGVRDDVPPEECRCGPKADVGAPLPVLPSAAAEAEGAARDAATRALGQPYRRVGITNRRKVFFPELGLTKADLCAYYEAVAPALLPYLADRPCVLVRYPNGIEGRSFHQWNAPRWAPKWLRTRMIRSKNREMHVFLIDDVDALLFVANLGCIPIQISGARVTEDDATGGLPDACDFFTLDLDVPEPSVGARTFADAVQLALDAKSLFDELGLASFAKTSGQRGLHVLVPLGGAPFAAAHALANLVAKVLEARRPELATTALAIAERAGRVFLDVGHTHPLRTIVAPYSLRAHPLATVSTPLSWDEVSPSLDPREHTLLTVPTRLAREGDPMRAMWTVSVDVLSATAALERVLRSQSSIGETPIK